MYKYRIIVGLFVLVISILGGSSISLANNDTPSINEQIKFRESFGLDNNIDKIKLLNQNDKQGKGRIFEVPLTEKETMELMERFEVQNNNLPKIKKMLNEKFNQENVTMYIDQSKGGEVVVKLKNYHQKSASTELFKELKSINLTIPYRIEEAFYSEEDLNAISDAIWAKKAELNLDFDSTRVDVVNEKIIIGIVEYSTIKEEELLKIFNNYPIEVEQIESPRNFRGPYGGELIVTSRGNTCSTGYYATSGSNYYLVTAGHCSILYDKVTTKQTTYYTDVYKYGTTTLGQVSSIRHTGYVDALTIKVPSSMVNSNIYLNGAVRKMTSSQARNADIVGQAVCKTGKTTFVTCGTLISKNTSYEVWGNQFIGMRSTNLHAEHGDSGGTVYNNFQYLGIIKGTHGGYVTYTHIAEINRELSLSTYLQ
ncbi:S1 family peptidase [Lysinibacillus louembei]|uniref:S1 family peptidase n=1 Tax=Lysinibacillus louembei TaxID=1470088 RepID=A0ABZ0S1G8_9BACI|nr:S1 family peptidase [Lysinibacillus louembei]WPK13514.1 S1 family peptidase [Lysinibacillus louembei]